MRSCLRFYSTWYQPGFLPSRAVMGAFNPKWGSTSSDTGTGRAKSCGIALPMATIQTTRRGVRRIGPRAPLRGHEYGHGHVPQDMTRSRTATEGRQAWLPMRPHHQQVRAFVRDLVQK